MLTKFVWSGVFAIYLFVIFIIPLLITLLTCQCCKFRNFHVTSVLQIFDFRIIGDLLNLQASTHAVNKAYDDSLLVRTSFLYDNKLANISEN